MPAKLQEIEGIYRGERFRKGDFVIGAIELVNGSRLPDVDGWLTIKGECDPEDLERAGRYRFYGRFSSYRNRRTGQEEKQFDFQTFCVALTHDKEGIIEYLVRAGRGNGLGKATATKAWEKYGTDAVRIIREDPTLLMELSKSIRREEAITIGDVLRQQAATEDATIELTNLLAGRGFPKTTAKKAIKEWGNRAAEIIRRDPYALMNFRGCGFKLCDALWIELGLNPHRLRRQALCAWYSIASQSEGHTWYPVEYVANAVRQAIGGTNANPVRAIKLATRLGRLSPNHYGALAAARTDGDGGPIVSESGRVWLAEGKRAAAEDDLARMVANAVNEAKPPTITEWSPVRVSWEEAATAVQCHRCSRELTAPDVHIWNGKPFGPTCIQYISDGTDVTVVSLDDWIARQPPIVQQAIFQLPRQQEINAFSLWPDPAKIIGIDEHQRMKFAEALVSRVAILGGGPGTGKTYATAMLIKALLASGIVSVEDIAVGAPTGKAAVRITEAMQAAGVPLVARTWHSLLGVGEANTDGGWTFQHNERNPWPYRIIIGDETSMVDTALMKSIFAARPRGCHVLLVGDVNQLPPVGVGAPLRDMIASGTVGYGELTEIKRNSGGIVEACAAIRDGKPWDAGDNLVINQVAGEEHQLNDLMGELVYAKSKGFDPVWDCQVLVAVNGRSKLSRKAVNELLQERLNPNPKVQGTPFRIADKIVCLKNGRYQMLDGDAEPDTGEIDEVYVANGELAKVIAIEEKSIIAELSNPRRVVRIPRGKASSDDGDSEESSGAGCNWDLAYGLSVHKSQGSEWPVAIVMLDEYPGAKMVCSREWLYTGISRAKSRCVLIGKKATADVMCRRVAIGKRKTLLRERLQMAVCDSVLESL